LADSNSQPYTDQLHPALPQRPVPSRGIQRSHSGCGLGSRRSDHRERDARPARFQAGNSVIGRAAARFPLGGRKGAWWGVAFVILLLVSAAMVSLPTAAEPGDRIAAFYAAHQQVIVWQQIVGTLALVPFLAFAAALSRWARIDGRRNRWLMPAAGLVALATVATSLVAAAMALMPDLSPALAHQLTVIEDLADSVLFASLAGFVLAASTGAPVWVRA